MCCSDAAGINETMKMKHNVTMTPVTDNAGYNLSSAIDIAAKERALKALANPKNSLHAAILIWSFAVMLILF